MKAYKNNGGICFDAAAMGISSEGMAIFLGETCSENEISMSFHCPHSRRSTHLNFGLNLSEEIWVNRYLEINPTAYVHEWNTGYIYLCRKQRLVP